MSEALTLASEFIERMANPGYGIRVNEDYSIRFGSLLSSQGFDDFLRDEIRKITNPGTLTPHGWLWLLGWARAKGIRLDEDLLLQLADAFSSVFMQVIIIDVATRHAEWERRAAVANLEEFQHDWLSKLLRRCTDIHREEGAEHDRVDTGRSETVLVALMQVGSDIALDAASTLLNHRWIGQSRLVEHFWSLCSELDEETRRNWITRLRPPDRNSPGASAQ